MTKLCPRGKSAAKRKFKVYPSAYANAYASKICAGKIKDPSGVKRKDFRGKKAEGGLMEATSRLKRQETSELSPKTRFPTKTKERKKKQEKKITLNKKYWEAQEKRKDPDYPLLKEEKKEKHPLLGFKTPRAFEDAKNKTPYINKSGKWVKHSKRKIPKLVIKYDNHLPKNRKRIK